MTNEDKSELREMVKRCIREGMTRVEVRDYVSKRCLWFKPSTIMRYYDAFKPEPPPLKKVT